jgi:hypothetical protein
LLSTDYRYVTTAVAVGIPDTGVMKEVETLCPTCQKVVRLAVWSHRFATLRFWLYAGGSLMALPACAVGFVHFYAENPPEAERFFTNVMLFFLGVGGLWGIFAPVYFVWRAKCPTFHDYVAIQRAGEVPVGRARSATSSTESVSIYQHELFDPE